jgi:hypothetical protein
MCTQIKNKGQSLDEELAEVGVADACRILGCTRGSSLWRLCAAVGSPHMPNSSCLCQFLSVNSVSIQCQFSANSVSIQCQFSHMPHSSCLCRCVTPPQVREELERHSVFLRSCFSYYSMLTTMISKLFRLRAAFRQGCCTAVPDMQMAKWSWS